MLCMSLLRFMIPFGGVTAVRLSTTSQNTTSLIHNNNPAVAIMIVGRRLSPDEADKLDSSTMDSNSPMNEILSGLTGEDQLFPMANKQFIGVAKENQQDDIWGNMQTSLHSPLSKTYEVDTILCVDSYDIGGSAPLNVQAHAFPAESQLERWHECLKRIVSDKYEWIIKVRPDYFYYKPIPDLSTFNNNYIYTRFRTAGGIQHLTSDHFSYTYCDPGCNAGGIGYMNDDMLFVMPASVVSILNGTSLPKQHLQVPPSWVPLVWAEGVWSKLLLDAGILTMPLAAPGFPRHDKFGHHGASAPCADVPVAKNCGDDAMEISDVHETLRDHH